MKRLALLGAVLLLTVAGANAQVDSVAIAEELRAAWEKAEANGPRPGDEGLSCDQLKMELDAAETDPTIRQRLADLEAGTQEAMRRNENAKALGKTLLIGRAALGVAVAGQQGAEGISLFATHMQIAIMTAQANAAAPLAAAMKANVLAILPHYGRTMHVSRLAYDKGCFRPPAQP